MQRATHHLLGASAGLGLAAVSGWPAWQAGAAAGLAALTAGGPFSPDADAYRWWRLADRWLPDEVLGHGGPLGHRRLSHWWGVPALAGAVVLSAAAVHPGWPWWVAWALLGGWASHLLGDWLFGRASPYEGRGAGIPLAPWWGHSGVGLDVGGPLEAAVRWVVLPALIGWQAWSLVT
jgi:hypothetical protein